MTIFCFTLLRLEAIFRVIYNLAGRSFTRSVHHLIMITNWPPNCISGDTHWATVQRQLTTNCPMIKIEEGSFESISFDHVRGCIYIYMSRSNRQLADIQCHILGCT